MEGGAGLVRVTPSQRRGSRAGTDRPVRCEPGPGQGLKHARGRGDTGESEGRRGAVNLAYLDLPLLISMALDSSRLGGGHAWP